MLPMNHRDCLDLLMAPILLDVVSVPLTALLRVLRKLPCDSLVVVWRHGVVFGNRRGS